LPAFQIKNLLNLFQHITNRYSQGVLALVVLLVSSCSPARYVPKGDYLLSRNHLETAQKSLSKDQLKTYIIQKPNKRIVGARFYLFLYNLSDINKVKWPHNWLRKIGEEPVVYSPALTKNSAGQLKQFLENKGYYHAEVHDTVTFKRKNAKVTYSIKPNDPYRIKHIAYSFEDTGLISRILPDTLNSLLKKGMKFDKDVLKQERVRIETLLKEQGYYHFSKEYIFYNATINAEKKSVDLVMHFKEYIEGTTDPHTKVKHHPRYRISDVYIYPDYSNMGADSSVGTAQLHYDTVYIQKLHFLNSSKPNIKPTVIINSNDIVPGEYYKLSDVNRTYRNLSELSIVRFTNINFKELDSIATFGSDRYLDCHIELTQKKLQSYQTEIVGTNSAGDLGIRGNLLYQNLNLFRGAEVFNMRITGAIEALYNQSKGKYKSMKEIGAESNVVFPKFFSPFRLESFVKKYSPKTSISVSFNYQSRPDYTRSIANGSFSYRWNANNHLTHTLWPLELNYVKIYQNSSSAAFIDSIIKTPLGYSFEDHVINVARYGFELNNQAIGKSRNFIFTRFSIESAGNLVNLYNNIFDSNNSGAPNKLLKVPYFQYLRGDLDFRYYNVIDKQNRFVYRLFVGIGYPYGNSTNLPYEKKYFAGGPNSMRAWVTRDLGPGSDTTSSSLFAFPNKNGDMKLEANIEYRFKVIWKMESAIFVDMGNIWAIREDKNKPGAEFAWNRFHNDIAVGAGIGVRFDFSFFLLRVDVGIKLRDPARIAEKSKWIPVFKEFGMNDLHWNFGIGYPF
jgi:outer membrane protein assembly factor BamA